MPRDFRPQKFLVYHCTLSPPAAPAPRQAPPGGPPRTTCAPPVVRARRIVESAQRAVVQQHSGIPAASSACPGTPGAGLLQGGAQLPPRHEGLALRLEPGAPFSPRGVKGRELPCPHAASLLDARPLPQRRRPAPERIVGRGEHSQARCADAAAGGGVSAQCGGRHRHIHAWPSEEHVPRYLQALATGEGIATVPIVARAQRVPVQLRV
eukprot:scaffold58355_cov66-Phaeocystis_antarctica.AAC.5